LAASFILGHGGPQTLHIPDRILNHVLTDARVRNHHYCLRGALSHGASASSLRATTYQTIAGGECALIGSTVGASGRGEVRAPPHQDSAKCDSEQARAKQDKTNHGHSEENEFLAHGTLFALCSQRGALKARNRAGTAPLYGGFFCERQKNRPQRGAELRPNFRSAGSDCPTRF
jgi:hypothetical protein